VSIDAETSQATAKRLMGEIDAASKQQYTRGEVKMILHAIAARQDADATLDEYRTTCRAATAVQDLRYGDVFIFKLVGGKVRPWVVLSVSTETVIAVGMSSGDYAPAMVPSQCRLWPGCFIGNTVSVFERAAATQEVTRPYTNLRHLDQVRSDIAAQYGMTITPPAARKIASMAEILERMRA